MKFVSFVSLVSVGSLRELVHNKWRILPWATGSIVFDTLSLFPNTHKIDSSRVVVQAKRWLEKDACVALVH